MGGEVGPEAHVHLRPARAQRIDVRSERPYDICAQAGREAVRPARGGELVRARDPEALAGAIRRVLELPVEERVRMGRAGREFVLDAFDVERESAKLARLIAATRGQDPIARYSSPPT